MEKSPSKVMVTIIFSHQGRRGRRRRRCSDGIEEDEAVGVPGTASSVEEEDGTMAIDGSAGGDAALSAWRKTTASGIEEEDGTMAIDGGMGGSVALSAWRKTTASDVAGTTVTVSGKLSNT